MLDKRLNLKGLLRSGPAAKAPKADAVAEPSETPAKPVDFSHLGGKKVGHPVPVKTEKEISFEHLNGKVVRNASDHPTFKTNASAEPAESVRKEISFAHLGGKKVGHFRLDTPEEPKDDEVTD